MLRHKIVIFSILALLVFLTACRSEPAPTSGNASVSAASRAFSNPGEPTIQQAMAEQPGDSPSPGAASDGQLPTPPQNPLAVAGSAESVPIGLSPAVDPAISAAASPETAAAESTPSVEEDLAIIQGIIEEYWAALNDYDVDHAITMLEESYRETEEELIRSDIGRMKALPSEARRVGGNAPHAECRGGLRDIPHREDASGLAAGADGIPPH